MTRYFRLVAGLMGTSAMTLSLAACKFDNRPLLARNDARPAYDAAPALGPLDPGYGPAPAALPPMQAYAYPERAYTVSRAAYQRPPSYAFAYDNGQPWAWDVADEGLMFAEPYGGDDWRYYYYEPGEDYPYYVQDADYGYAYGDDGALLALFTAAGVLIGADRYDEYRPRAGYYWTRAEDLNRNYYRAPRYRVEDAVWRERAPVVFRSQDRWYRAFEAQPGWREAARHDNGRHLGWYKDRDDQGRNDQGRGQRQFAYAAPPQRLEGGRREQGGIERGVRREDHGARENRGNQGRQAARVDREPRAHGDPHQDRGGGREARQNGGGQQGRAEARNAGGRGHDAAWRGAERPKGGGQQGGERGGRHGGGEQRQFAQNGGGGDHGGGGQRGGGAPSGGNGRHGGGDKGGGQHASGGGGGHSGGGEKGGGGGGGKGGGHGGGKDH